MSAVSQESNEEKLEIEVDSDTELEEIVEQPRKMMKSDTPSLPSMWDVQGTGGTSNWLRPALGLGYMGGKPAAYARSGPGFSTYAEQWAASHHFMSVPKFPLIQPVWHVPTMEGGEEMLRQKKWYRDALACKTNFTCPINGESSLLRFSHANEDRTVSDDLKIFQHQVFLGVGGTGARSFKIRVENKQGGRVSEWKEVECTTFFGPTNAGILNYTVMLSFKTKRTKVTFAAIMEREAAVDTHVAGYMSITENGRMSGRRLHKIDTRHHPFHSHKAFRSRIFHSITNPAPLLKENINLCAARRVGVVDASTYNLLKAKKIFFGKDGLYHVDAHLIDQAGDVTDWSKRRRDRGTRMSFMTHEVVFHNNSSIFEALWASTNKNISQIADA